MGENITKIKVGDDVRCLSLDTEVIDTNTLGFDGSGNLGVKLGSSMRSDIGGIGVKIHPDTCNYLRCERDGLSLKLDTLADAMRKEFELGTSDPLYVDGYGQLKKSSADAYGVRLCLATFGRDGNFLVFRQTSGEDTGLSLGSGFAVSHVGNHLDLKLGSGLWFDNIDNDGKIKVNAGDLLTFDPQNSQLTINKPALCAYLESVYNLEKK